MTACVHTGIRSLHIYLATSQVWQNLARRLQAKEVHDALAGAWAALVSSLLASGAKCNMLP